MRWHERSSKILSGSAEAAGRDAKPLAAFCADLRSTFGGDPIDQPGRARWRPRDSALRSRLTSTVAKLGVGAVAAALGFGGVAAAGALPAPVQHDVAKVAGRVGLGFVPDTHHARGAHDAHDGVHARGGPGDGATTSTTVGLPDVPTRPKAVAPHHGPQPPNSGAHDGETHRPAIEGIAPPSAGNDNGGDNGGDTDHGHHRGPSVTAPHGQGNGHHDGDGGVGGADDHGEQQGSGGRGGHRHRHEHASASSSVPTTTAHSSVDP
ncbi:MAG TPA: hypothetical protein VGO03_20345 [Acidimicrobiia bacterium]